MIKVAAYTLSLDGYSAGPNQTLEAPMGERGGELHQWFFPTRVFQQKLGKEEGGTTGVDNAFAEKSFENLGAWIMGRNMFGPVRGSWPDDKWKGWWGEVPPYHVPVFVLTHHPREPLHMAGGTTFYFVTDGIESALEQAKKAANGKDIRIGGGASTIRQYLQAGHIDQLHIALSPVLLGKGESIFEGIDLPKLGYAVVETVFGEKATHLIIQKV